MTITRYIFTSVALSSIILASGMLHIPANAQTTSSTSTNTQSAPTIADLEQAVYNQINQYRASKNLAPLSVDARISEQARTHSQNMANGTVAFSHDGFSGRVEAIATSIPYSAAAENVAYNAGYTDPATQAVQGWLKSTGHRQNIEGNYNLTGIGIAKNVKGQYYFTQIFIRSASGTTNSSTATKNPSTQSAPTIADLEQAVYNQINQYRASQGLALLSVDARISEQARTHSQNMTNGTVAFSHDGFSGRVEAIATSIPYSAAAENVAYNAGYADPATQAVQGWLKSTGHRQNIAGNYNLTGIGIAKNAKGEYYFTQIFIRSR